MVTPEELMDIDEYQGPQTPLRTGCARKLANAFPEICEDVREECEKYGTVEGLEIPRPSGGSRMSAGVGKIFVKYDKPESAQKALRALAGRKFADRTVVVTFFGEAPPIFPTVSDFILVLILIPKKPFGLKKKEKDGDEDSNRSALFGSRSSKNNAPSTNPYAQPPSNSGSPDPHAARPPSIAPSVASTLPPPYGSSASFQQPRRDKSPVPPGGYGAAQAAYGGQGAYGGNRYGDNGASNTRGPGGYGGLGRRASQDTMTTDAGREALFGDAPQRIQQQRQIQTQLPPENGETGSAGYSDQSGANGSQDQGYGAYQDRQLTAEEEEEEDVQASKQQIRFMKQQDVSSTRNALRIALLKAQAEETGRETLNRLGAQGDRIHNTERNLDSAAAQNRLAEEKARELKTLNRSMFAMHVNNPFTAQKRRDARDEAVMTKHRSEREQRDATRAAAFSSTARKQEVARDLRGNPIKQQSKASLAERSKYQFEADSEDEEMENEIDSNLDALHGAATRLNQLGRAMGTEVDS
ncbi:hypothetical protein LTR04_003978 [Oleoguttula sp. CCFEE 6159]|nr:hypothetical protein LTR04_003978 [Oleoguttula sp. CCFEE 6159]